MTLDDLLRLDRAGLAAVFARGGPVDTGDLADRTLAGVALGNPDWFHRLTWRKFAKVFRSDGHGGLVGHNRAVRQNPLTEPWTERRIFGRPVIYGRFRVAPGPAVIDYGLARDPLVRVGPDLLLGVTEIAGRRTPTWFALDASARVVGS